MTPSFSELAARTARQSGFPSRCPDRQSEIGAAAPLASWVFDRTRKIIVLRVKSVSAELRDRIVQAAFHDIEQEIARLDHEKRLLESMGIGPSQDDLDAVEAALEAARTGLARMRASR